MRIGEFPHLVAVLVENQLGFKRCRKPNPVLELAFDLPWPPAGIAEPDKEDGPDEQEQEKGHPGGRPPGAAGRGMEGIGQTGSLAGLA